VSYILYFTIIGLLSNVLGQALPRRWFDWGRFPYVPAKWEKDGAVYEKLHIQAWKTHMPDISRIMPNMVPKKIRLSATSQEIDMLLRETCVAEFVHIVLCILGIIKWFVWHDFAGRLLIVIWVVVGNLPFVFIQRYNRPRMQRLYNIVYQKECVKAAAV